MKRFDVGVKCQVSIFMWYSKSYFSRFQVCISAAHNLF